MFDSMVFYRSFFDAIKGFSVEEQVLIYDSIFNYAFDLIEPSNEELPQSLQPIFMLIKPQMDANIKKRVNGAKGGRPKKITEKPVDENKETIVINKETYGFIDEYPMCSDLKNCSTDANESLVLNMTNHSTLNQKPNANVSENVSDNINNNTNAFSSLKDIKAFNNEIISLEKVIEYCRSKDIPQAYGEIFYNNIDSLSKDSTWQTQLLRSYQRNC